MRVLTNIFCLILISCFIGKIDNLGINKSTAPYSTYYASSSSNFDPMESLMDFNKEENFNEITTAESCGKGKFPHGIWIDPSSKNPKMYCELHHCSRFENVRCIQNVRIGGCSASNEWIAGFHSSGIGTPLKVECCRYKDIRFTAFVKTVYFSASQIWEHSGGRENEEEGEIEFINNIKKVETLKENEVIYSGTVYRMKCPTSKTSERTIDSPSTTPPSNLINRIPVEQQQLLISTLLKLFQPRQ